jgi:putative ABC transport system ATP-binding protein
MLQIQNVTKKYSARRSEVTAVEQLSIHLQPGDLAVVHGHSGSGKSTLLFMAGGMLPPDSGSVTFQNQQIYQWPTYRRNRFRNHSIGFIFQRFHLIPYLSVRENIRLPLHLQPNATSRAAETKLIESIACRLQIDQRLNHLPAALSVGEQQRVAVARSIIGKKQLILADEPTGNLDTENAEIVAKVLKEESSRGRIVMVVTHDPSLLTLGNISLCLKNGRRVESVTC